MFIQNHWNDYFILLFRLLSAHNTPFRSPFSVIFCSVRSSRRSLSAHSKTLFKCNIDLTHQLSVRNSTPNDLLTYLTDGDAASWACAPSFLCFHRMNYPTKCRQPHPAPVNSNTPCLPLLACSPVPLHCSCCLYHASLLAPFCPNFWPYRNVSCSSGNHTSF